MLTHIAGHRLATDASVVLAVCVGLGLHHEVPRSNLAQACATSAVGGLRVVELNGVWSSRVDVSVRDDPGALLTWRIGKREGELWPLGQGST